MPHCVDASGNATACQAPLSYGAMLKMAYAAGFRGLDLLRIVAIAQAESSGIPNVTNGTAYGLTQVVPSAHSDLHPSTGALIDPATSFKLAYDVYYQSYQANGASGRWDAWTTYSSGAYKQYMAAVAGAAGMLQGKSSGDLATQLGDAVGQWSRWAISGSEDTVPLASLVPPWAAGWFQDSNPLATPPSIPGVIGNAITGPLQQAGFIILGVVAVAIGVYLLVNPSGQMAAAIREAGREEHK